MNQIMFYFLGLIASLFLVIKSADYAILYSTKISTDLKIPRYIIGFLLIAVISALPETFISINSAFQNNSVFGLGILLGANVADLTLIFAIVTFLSSHSIKVKSKIIKNEFLYIFMIGLPVVLGLNGQFSRFEGAVLVLAGFYFFWILLLDKQRTDYESGGFFSWKYFSLLLVSMAALLFTANLTAKFGVSFAQSVHIHPVLIGMFFVGLGTTLPELFFSIKAVWKKQDELAIGDILGMVITDSTIVVGIVALIRPFSFNKEIIYITGGFMVAASIILLYLLRTGKILTKKEALFLIFFYLLFVFAEFSANNYF
jgi:cation:H+ antiporter